VYVIDVSNILLRNVNFFLVQNYIKQKAEQQKINKKIKLKTIIIIIILKQRNYTIEFFFVFFFTLLLIG
jgi:hypothetical protein